MTKLSEAIDVFIEYVCAGKRNETPATYRTKLHQLVVRLGDRSIEAISVNDLDDFRVSLLNQKQKMRGKQVIDEPLTDWYVRGVLKTVKHLFRWMTDTGRLSLDPAVNLALPARTQPQPKAAEPEVIDKMFVAATVVGPAWEQARNTALVQLLRSTGSRIGGLLAATVQDTDLTEGVIWTREKGGRKKKLFLTESTREIVRRWLEVRATLNPLDDRLFIGQNGRGLTRSGAEKIWNRLAEAAGVTDQRHNFHSFRHAFARDSIRAGADLSHVSQMMGHSSSAITSDYYLQYTHDELQEVHARVSPTAVSPAGGADPSPTTATALLPSIGTEGILRLSSLEDPVASAGRAGSVVVLAIGPINQVAMNRLIGMVRELRA
ncbi:MAG: tyrosine-type recombinase/integrase [Chloroflexi bacterium]|nr:tyrosine-type recombinase/integrase [Chloroflexota bacterium]